VRGERIGEGGEVGRVAASEAGEGGTERVETVPDLVDGAGFGVAEVGIFVEGICRVLVHDGHRSDRQVQST
jgi:hypothetical protein